MNTDDDEGINGAVSADMIDELKRAKSRVDMNDECFHYSYI